MAREDEACKGPWASHVSAIALQRFTCCLVGPARLLLADAEMPGVHVQEDALLRRLIAQHGTANWSLIAKFVPGRSGKSCKWPALSCC